MNDLTGYQVFRSSFPDSQKKRYAFVPSASNSFVDIGVTFDVEYEYQISAVGDNFESLRSETKQIVPGPTFTWATERSGRQVVKLTHDSRHIIFKIGGFSTIVDVEVNPKTGDVWLLDRFGIESSLKRIKPNGKVDERFIPFDGPNDVSLDYKSNRIWVADAARSTVTKLDIRGNSIFTINAFKTPTLVSVDQRNGNCWVVDNETKSVSRVLSDGTQILKSDVHFSTITGLDLNSGDGSVWIADSARVVKMDENGDFLLEITVPLTKPEKIAVNEDSGNVWIINDNPAGLYKFSGAGAKVIDVGVNFNPDELSVNLYDNSVSVLDVRGHTIYKIAENGETLGLFTDLIFPDLISVQNQDRTN